MAIYAGAIHQLPLIDPSVAGQRTGQIVPRGVGGRRCVVVLSRSTKGTQVSIRRVTHAIGAAALALTVMTTATACSDKAEKDTPGDIDNDEKNGGDGEKD